MDGQLTSSPYFHSIKSRLGMTVNAGSPGLRFLPSAPIIVRTYQILSLIVARYRIPSNPTLSLSHCDTSHRL